MTRRAVLALAMAAAVASSIAGSLTACKRHAEERCKTCGMKIDPTSTWRTELVAGGGGGGGGDVTAFDTPRCALKAWKGGRVPAASMRVREYYDATGPMRDARELRFVKGGDVVGPMGPDLVPVEPSRVTKFIQDHGADRALRLDEITPAELE
jgi:hypothetical protein